MDTVQLLVLGDSSAPELRLLDDLRSAATVTIADTPSACERIAPRVDVILNWLSSGTVLREIWPIAARLQWVHVRSAGLDGLLFPEIAESPVILTNARGVFSEMLSEFTIGAVLFFAKDFRRLVVSQMAARWDPFYVTQVRGQTLGLVGYGDIGRAVAVRAHALGIKVVALRRRPELSRDDSNITQVFGLEQKRQMLLMSDYVVVCAPLTAETRGMLGLAEFRAMKSTAVLINIGRGPVVDEAALIRALSERRIRGAALDVFDTEPLGAGHPFYSLDNVLLSPHSADQTSDWKERAMRVFLENFRRFERGEPVLNVVNKKLGY